MADYSVLSLEELLATPANQLGSRVAEKFQSTISNSTDETKTKLMKKIWDRVDVDGDGTLDKDELRQVLVQMGKSPEEIDMDVVMADVDKDGDGEIDFREFEEWFNKQESGDQEAMYVVHYRTLSGGQAETTLDKLPSLQASGEITDSTIIWMDGLDEWVPLKEAQASGGVADKLKSTLGAATDESKTKMMKKVWDRVDADNSGGLDKNELRQVLVQMGKNVEELDMDQLMVDVGGGGDVDITFDQFEAWFDKQDGAAQEAMHVVFYKAKSGEQAETTLDKLPDLLASGEITDSTIIWMDGLDEWVPLKEAQASGGVADKLKSTLGAATDESKTKLMKKIWDRVDADNSGGLDKDELRQVLVQMGKSPEEIDIDVVMADVGGGGDVDITFDQFEEWFNKQDNTDQEHMYVVHYRTQSGGQAETTLDKLPDLLASGEITDSTIIWMDGLDEWVPLKEAQASSGDASHRRDCHFADATSPSLLKRLQRQRGTQQNDSLADG